MRNMGFEVRATVSQTDSEGVKSGTLTTFDFDGLLCVVVVGLVYTCGDLHKTVVVNAVTHCSYTRMRPIAVAPRDHERGSNAEKLASVR